MGKPTYLRSQSIPLTLHKYDLKNLQAELKQYHNIENIQPFIPTFEKLFKMEKISTPLLYGIQLKEQVKSILSSETLQISGGTRPYFVKKSMILSPYKWMQDKYANLGTPSVTKKGTERLEKLQNPNNSAYVGSLFASLLSESECPNFPKVYGIFSGNCPQFDFDISEDYEELIEANWFNENIGKTFELKRSESKQSSAFKHTRSNRHEVDIGNEIELDIPELESAPLIAQVDRESEDNASILLNIDSDENSCSSSVTTSTTERFDIQSCKCEEVESYDIDMENADIEPFAWATFKDAPIQLTFMEKCEGRLSNLFKQYEDTEKQTAWLAQVVCALAFAQNKFGFVHNDLHGWNIMYVTTDKEFLHYNVNGIFYKIPTYGYIIKIIDFERGLGSVRLKGMRDSKFFMSDHFSKKEQACGQYNCEPFFISKLPSIKPNPSFDLVRLASDLFFQLFPKGHNDEYADNFIYKLFIRWTTLSDNKSVLYVNKDTNHERYHGMDFYKAIARYCKNAVPINELKSFSMFQSSSIPDEFTTI